MNPQTLKLRCCIRWNGQIIRVLAWSSFADCPNGGPARDFIYRLPASDRRPFGRRLCCDSQARFDWYAALPIGEWCEIVSPADRVLASEEAA